MRAEVIFSVTESKYISKSRACLLTPSSKAFQANYDQGRDTSPSAYTNWYALILESSVDTMEIASLLVPKKEFQCKLTIKQK